MKQNHKKTKTKILNVKFDPETYVKFSAAAEILQSRSIAAHIHTFVLQSIEKAEAQNIYLFGQVVEEHRARINARSRAARAESQSRKPKGYKIKPNGTTALPLGVPSPAGKKRKIG